MDPRSSQARPSVPSWDEIMLRQRPAVEDGHDRPIAAERRPAADRPAPDAGLRRDERPAVGAIRLDQLGGGRARVDVELVHARTSVRGAAERATVAAAAADATVSALNDLAGPAARFEVTAVDATGDRVVVELTAASPDGTHRLVGAVAVNGQGLGGATVRATLDAVNRPLSRWLAPQPS